MDPTPANKALSVALIALAQVLALALWFSVTAVAPDLAVQRGLSPVQVGSLALAVQLGFVVGGLASAAAGLADRFDPRDLFSFGALAGAAANALFLWIDPAGPFALASRFLVGLSLACVYPVGMKMATSWATRGDAGLLVGIVVGALTLGSAAPHGFAWAGGVSWRHGVAAASVSAVAAAALIRLSAPGPRQAAASAFSPFAALEVVRDPAIRLATAGYLGHMWELYAGWTWIGALMAHSFAAGTGKVFTSGAEKLAAFVIIAAGAAGCVLAGWLADRIGRTTVTIWAMGVSGLACLAFAPVYGSPPALILTVGVIWGVAVIADSAQFSASVAELSPPARTGSLLTIQTALGFALTAVSIRLLPVWTDVVGWRWAFAPLALGPAAGIAAMAALRRRPEALKLAGGRR